MQISFRAGRPRDFDHCRRLYFAGLETVTAEQEFSFRQRWIVSEVRIITCADAEIGWLQSRILQEALFLVQLFVEPGYQGKGVGTSTLQNLMKAAARAGVPLTLGVVKTNPALRLYERLGFEVTREDDRKLYMKCGSAGGQQS